MNIQEMFRVNTKYFRPIQNCVAAELAGLGNFGAKSFKRPERDDPEVAGAIIRGARTNSPERDEPRVAGESPAAIIRGTRTNGRPKRAARATA